MFCMALSSGIDSTARCGFNGSRSHVRRCAMLIQWSIFISKLKTVGCGGWHLAKILVSLSGHQSQIFTFELNKKNVDVLQAHWECASNALRSDEISFIVRGSEPKRAGDVDFSICRRGSFSWTCDPIGQKWQPRAHPCSGESRDVLYESFGWEVSEITLVPNGVDAALKTAIALRIVGLQMSVSTWIVDTMESNKLSIEGAIAWWCMSFGSSVISQTLWFLEDFRQVMKYSHESLSANRILVIFYIPVVFVRRKTE